MHENVEDIPATSHFDFLYGSFHSGNWVIPYFATTLTFSEAAKALRLTTEIPGAETIEWKLEELFQRDIDWPRVETKIVPYLSDGQSPQFFNAITIALLPYDESTGELVPSFLPGHPWSPPGLAKPDRFAKELTIGPISFGYWSEWENIADSGFASGQLRWNREEIMGVAIDGQHRLAAIKAVEGASGGGSVSVSRVPVLLLLFDERVGFRSADSQPVVELLRRLFIDLNKHAKIPSRARQILLDDRDPLALCVRALIGEQLSKNVDALKGDPPRMPLSLIDWYSEQAKFSEGPFHTTILGLDKAIAKVLETSPLNDFVNYSGVMKQLSALEKSLGISLEAAIARCESLASTQQTPFSYTEDELENIGTSFQDVWAPALCCLLTEFEPYQDLLSLRKKGSLELEYQHWYELYEQQKGDKYEGRAKQAYRQFVGRMEQRQSDPTFEADYEKMLSDINEFKNGNLAFAVVFQRAYIDAFIEYQRIRPEAKSELIEYWSQEAETYPDFGSGDYEDIEEEAKEARGAEVPRVDASSAHSELGALVKLRAGEFVSTLNKLVAGWQQVLDVGARFKPKDGEEQYFWAGTLRKPDGSIDFTQAASARAHDLIFMLAAMIMFDEHVEPDEESAFSDFWGECVIDEDVLAFCKRIRMALGRWAKESGGGGKILRERDEEYEYDLALDSARERLEFVWGTLGL